MADYLELLRQAATKQTEVAVAAEQKKAELAANATSTAVPAMPTADDFYQIAAGMGNERGAQTMSPLETDLRTLNPSQLYAKYGAQATELIAGRAQGGYALQNDRATPARSAGELLGDTLSGVGTGFANAFAGIGALGVGLVNAEAGEQLSQEIEQANQWVRENQSSQLNSARRVEQAGAALNRRDSAFLYEQDRQTDGEVMASLKQIGRDVIDTLDTATDSPVTFGQGTADAVGSLLAAGPLAAGIRKAGITALSQLGRAGALSLENGARLHAVGSRLTMPAVIAGMESGGTFQGTAADVAAMTPEQLRQNSPYYNELIAQGLSHEQARAEVGNRAGLMAAAIQAPVAAATGALVSRFEGNPLAATSARAAISNALLREPVEEAIQSGTSQLAQNVGVQRVADQSQSLSEGVGEGAALGGLFGMGAGTVVQGPAAFADAATRTGQAATTAVGNFIDQRVVDVQQATAEAAPDSPENLAAKFDKATTDMPDAEQAVEQAVANSSATPEQKAAAQAYSRSLFGSLRFDPAELEQEGVPAVVKDLLTGSKNRADSVERLMGALDALPENHPDELNLAFGLYAQLEPINELLDADPALTDLLAEDDPGRMIAEGYTELMGQLRESSRVQAALQKVEALVSAAAENGSLQPVTEEDLATPEGQQQVQNAITAATIAPHKGNSAVPQAILEQAERGKLNLTPAQQASLMTSVTLLRAAEDYDKAAEQAGLSKMDIVSKQIKTDTSRASENAKSAFQHAQAVVQAKRAGNDQLAAQRLVDFGRFVQHMQNKVGAFNAHFQGGNPKAPGVKYQALRMDASRGWKESSEGLKVHPTKANSLKFAQSVGLEAKALADIYEGLRQAFPELNSAPVTPVALDSRLVGNAVELAERFANPQAPAEQAAPNQEEEVTTPEAVAEEANDLMPWDEDPAEPEQTVPTDAPAEEAVPENDEPLPWEDAPATAPELVGQAGPKPLNPASPNAAVVRRFLEWAAQDDELDSFAAGPFTVEVFNASPSHMESENVLHVTLHRDQRNTSFYGWNGQLYRNVDLPNTLTAADFAQLQQLDLQELGKQFTPESPIVSRITVEQARRLSDSGLNARLDNLMEKRTQGTATAEDQATFTVLDEEMTRREDAVAAQVQQEQEQNQVEEEPDLQLPEQVEAEKTEPEEGIDFVFPDLVGSSEGKNFFKKAFTLPKTAKTRTIGSGSPVEYVQQALASSTSLSRLLGSKLRHKFDKDLAEAYGNYLSTVDNLKGSLDRQLQKFLKEKDRFNKFINGAPVNRYVNGKPLNLVEPVGRKLGYNQELIEGTVLAGLQWLLTAEDMVSPLEEEDLAKLVGIEVGYLQPDDLAAMNEGLYTTQAVRSLARKIQNFWGLSTNNAVSKSYTEGIPEAMAAEMIRTFVDQGLLRKTTVEFGAAHGLNSTKSYDRYISQIPKDSPLRAFPSAIEQVVMLEPEEITYIGPDLELPVAERQMNNPLVENTLEQKEALANEQETVFRLNPIMASFYTALGEQNIVKLFGGGDTEGRPFNANHAKTVDGRNRTLLSGYQALVNTLHEMSNVGEATGLALDQVPVRYTYNFSRVGRMQMLGKHNPQASKLVREALLPTWSTLDLSSENGEGFAAFGLGLAQALGIKVHTLTLEESLAKLHKLLDGALAPSVSLVQNWLATADLSNPLSVMAEIGEGDIETLQANFKAAGEAVTPMALHALTEFARYRSADAEQRKAFTTAVYLEADGVTNGPINAMALMSIGAFDERQLRNIAKGGMFVGRNKTMNQHRKEDNVDLYGASTQAFSGHMANLRKFYANDPKVTAQMNRLLTLMDMFFGNDLSFDSSTGELTVQRGLAKNPLTITIYGSGAAGIANKMAKMLVDKLYERMSGALQLNAADPAVDLIQGLFPGDPLADQKWETLVESLETLLDFEPKRAKGGFGHYLKPSLINSNLDYDFSKFTLNPEQFRIIQANMLAFFVEPMREGIEQTVGANLMSSVEVLRKAVQVQSIFLEDAFKSEVYTAMQEKQLDPEWRKGDFLSEKELGQIHKRLSPLAPIVSAPGQKFFIAGSESVDLHLSSYGRALDDSLESPPYVYGPTDAGVAGIPFMTIGTGDGRMMQSLSLDDTVTDTLKIFDGMNMPLDKIKEYSELANKAVYDSWKGNPLRAVLESWEKFRPHATLSEHPDPDTVMALTKALFPPQFWKTGVYLEDLWAEIDSLGEKLKWAARSVDARHQAWQSIQSSVDQMAAAGASYVTSGEVLPEGTTDDEILALLNERYREAMADSVAKPVAVDPVIKKAGRLDRDSGVRVLSYQSLRKLARSDQLSPAQRSLFNDLLHSLGAKEYTVVFGTPGQVKRFQKLNGRQPIQPKAGQEIRGVTSIGERTVYLFDPSLETLVHELTHVATYETVLGYYNGEQQSAEVKDAVRRIEKLREQFLNEAWDGLSPAEQQAFDDARSAIIEQESNLDASEAENKAGGLNEFMAWALTNQQIADRLATRRAHPLARIAKDVVAFLKKLIWGDRRAPKVFDDMLSNLRFNTGVVINSQPVAGALVNDATLYQSSSYGSDARLSEIRQTFTRKLADWLNSQPNTPAPLAKARGNLILDNAIDLANAVQGQGFSMSKQEESTFQMIVGALATQAKINPSSLVQAQQLFAHVLKKLDVEHFMDDPQSLDPAERYYAQQRYDVIVGKSVGQTDAQGRSSMLPVFLGLAMVNERFRKVLGRIEMPERSKATGGGVDAALENLGYAAMDQLAAKMTGTGRSTTVQEALDRLMDHVRATAQDEQTFIDQVADTVGGVADRANQFILDGVERLSDAALDGANRVLAGSPNKVIAAGANLAKLMALIASEKNAQFVAQDLMSQLNRTKVWQPLHDLINDMIGRTTSNAKVYDLIKATRSHVQQARQQFREVVPGIIMGKFSRALTDNEWSSLYRSLGKTDLASLLGRFSKTEVLELARDAAARRQAMRTLESEIKAHNPTAWPVYQRKIAQLAHYLNTGEHGNSLLRNAYAVAHLFGEQRGSNWVVPDAKLIRNIDHLVTLQALENLNQGDKDTLSSLVQSEAAGLSFTLSYLNGQRAEEQRKVKTSAVAQINHYKGYLPSEQQAGVTLRVAEVKEFRQLRERSFQVVAHYAGSSLDRFAGGKDYYFAPVSGRAAFNQGIVQNVRQTVSGVDPTYGYTTGTMTAGLIHDPVTVQRLSRELKREKPTREPLLPIFDENGAIIAFERSIDPLQLQRLNPNTHLAKMIGIWRGRQMEELESQFFNEKLVDALKAMHEADLKQGSSNQDQYVNLYDDKLLKDDPVLADAVNLLTPETRAYVQAEFGSEFWVRKDLLTDVVGHRMASVGDAWTGTTRWSKNAQDSVKRLAISVWGNEAYRKLVNGEQTLQNLVGDAKTMIVVKSIVVPFGNFVSNVFQLMARGTPLMSIARGLPQKTHETHAYVRSQLRKIEAEAELRAAEGDPVRTRKLRVEIQSIEDGHRRLSIWPLIEAGEFSAISDVGMTHEDLSLTSGRLNDYIEKQVAKLPKGVQTAGRYALLTRDSALFQGMQKAVQYSDFLAKAVLFDDLVNRKKLNQGEALARISEEFVNYDRLAGRFRGYLESVGLLWFYNFKIRSTKVALSMIRNNPLHTLLAANNPVAGLLSGGLPVDDNLLVKLFDGSLDYSVGPGQGIEAPLMNPVANLLF